MCKFADDVRSIIIDLMQTFYILEESILYCRENLTQQPLSDRSVINEKEHFKEALRIFKYVVLSLGLIIDIAKLLIVLLEVFVVIWYKSVV